MSHRIGISNRRPAAYFIATISKDVLAAAAVVVVLLNQADGSTITAATGLGVDPGHNIGSSTGGSFSGYDVGWEFTIAAPIEITALGKVVDPASTATSWEVAIYQVGTGGARMVDGTVLGSAPPVANGIYETQYTSVSPTILPAGTYDIYDRQNGDAYFFSLWAAMAPGITYDFLNYKASGPNYTPLDSTNPSYDGSPTGDGFGSVGPMFQFATVPEPSSAVLATLGAVGLIVLARRGRRGV